MKSSNLPLAWTATSEDRKAFAEQIVAMGDNPVIKRFVELLETRLKELNNKEISEAYYDNPNWASKQAFINGQRQALTQTLELLRFTKEE